MKIKRILLSNNDEDRYFSERQDELKNLSTSFDKVCIEIIKIIELYDIEYGQNINHWMTTLCSFFNNVSKSEKRIFNTNRLQLSFIKAIENSGTVSRILGDDFLRHCSSGFGKEYVRNLWEEILNMTQREEKKYVDAIRSNGGFLVTPEDYILLYKYIALCFSGQLNYETIDFWSDINTIQRTQVNYSFNSSITITRNIQRLIANCIFQFKGNVPDSGDYIIEYL